MIDRLPHEKGFHVSWDQLHRDARALAWRLDGTEWRAVVAVTRGGLVPAMIVARELDIRTIDSISIRSYKGVGAEAGPAALRGAHGGRQDECQAGATRLKRLSDGC